MRISVDESVRQAMTAIWSHRFRSLLTILGIVIGITTVITVSSLLTGLQKGVITFFEEFGPDSVFASRFSGDPGSSGTPKEQKRRPLRPEYAEFVRKVSPAIEDVAVSVFVPPVINGRAMTAKVPGFESDNVLLVGNTVNLQTIQPRELREGRYFLPEEASRGARAAVVGALFAEALWPAGSPVGRVFQLDGAEYQVVGVFEKAKGGFFGENGQDRQVTIPLRTAQLRYPQADRIFLTAKARTGRREDAFEEMQAALRRIRNVPRGADNDFSITTPDQIIKQFERITGLIVLVSIAISGLGLLVGGIGVMNIMLVSVTERTREIGVRKALGARRPDIVFQFLIEAVSLTAAGGVIGILFAVSLTLLVSVVFPSLPSETPLWAVAAGLIVSMGVGLFFGVWPAMKAARLDPVEALRYE
ncbi:MAG: ABC transporter permease [Acidobacteria bacterium]|nr:ABC transporter permease [Acidobacteriota bacterium]